MEVLKKTTVFRIEQQTKGLSLEEVTNIALNDVPLLPERIACFTALSHLTLVCMKPMLKSFLEIPLAAFPLLRMLDVGDNAISVTEALPTCPIVRKLFLSNNRITQWAELERIAAAFPKLEVLDLTDNKVDDPSRFNDIMALFPNLVSLDSKTRDGEEIVVADTDESSSGSVSSDGDDDDDDDDEEEEEDEEDDEDEEAPRRKAFRTE